MARIGLTDEQWDQIAPLLPGKAGDRGRTGADNRKTIEGILYIVRTGSPWRDLPSCYGNWNTIHRRFRRWAASGVFDRIFKATSDNLDLRSVMVDGSFAKVHQHGTGAKKAAARPKSRRGLKPSAGAGAGSTRR